MPLEKIKLNKRKIKKNYQKQLSTGKLKLQAMSKRKISFNSKLWTQRDKISS